MSFLKKIVEWIRHVGEEPEPATPEPVALAEAPVIPLKTVPTPAVPDFETLVQSSTKNFIDDLRSFRTVNDEFDRARADLLNELRNLNPKKRSPKARR